MKEDKQKKSMTLKEINTKLKLEMMTREMKAEGGGNFSSRL